MITLRILMLLATVAVCYLLFLRVGPAPEPAHAPGANRPDAAAMAGQDQYKAAMDKAHAAARQMQAQRREADSQ